MLGLLATAAPASGQWLDELRELDSNRARVTARMVDLADMSTIAALNPDMRLAPASVSKLFAAAGALEQFGPDHRFTSTFATGGAVIDGVSATTWSSSAAATIAGQRAAVGAGAAPEGRET